MKSHDKVALPSKHLSLCRVSNENIDTLINGIWSPIRTVVDAGRVYKHSFSR